MFRQEYLRHTTRLRPHREERTHPLCPPASCGQLQLSKRRGPPTDPQGPGRHPRPTSAPLPGHRKQRSSWNPAGQDQEGPCSWGGGVPFHTTLSGSGLCKPFLQRSGEQMFQAFRSRGLCQNSPALPRSVKAVVDKRAMLSSRVEVLPPPQCGGIEGGAFGR